MKKILITIFLLCIALLIFSGCVAEDKKDDDTNKLAGTDLQDNTAPEQNTDLQTDNSDNSGTEDNTNLETENSTTSDTMTYCIIQYAPTIKQEFWLYKDSARMYTQGENGVFTDKIINKETNCTKDEKGTHACFPMTEDFEQTKEGWLTLGQMSGTCTSDDYDASVFKFE
ncbi:MAG: hypothetical protein PHH82_01645 [Candidatus ainarchaeum sp.]|nr:hypothetical protein [Candidatus ainarchaeum sp.]